MKRSCFLGQIAIIPFVFVEESLIFRIKNNFHHFLIKVSYRFAFFSQTISSMENQTGALVAPALPIHGNILFTHGKYVVLMKKAARLSCSEKNRLFSDS